MPQCVEEQNNGSTAAELTLEPDSFSTIKIHVDVRAGFLMSCIPGRIIARAMAMAEGKMLSKKANRLEAAGQTGERG